MKARTRPSLRLSALLLALAASGCVAVAVVAIAAGAAYGVVKYKENEALRDYKEDFGPVWEATHKELKKMGYDVDPEAPPGVTSHSVTDDEIWVKVKRLDDTYTRVRVRVGTFKTDAHKRQARRLLNGIADRLE